MPSQALFRLKECSAIPSAVCVLMLLSAPIWAVEARQQQFTMNTLTAGEVLIEPLLTGEIPGVEATHIAVAGPASYSESANDDHALVLLFVDGKGKLEFQGKDYELVPETIAMPISNDKLTVHVEDGDTLHGLVIRKQYSEQDIEDMKEFAARDSDGIYLKKFTDCESYKEAIKSPKTTSRTVLPKDHISRCAMGTVETMGPDEVGAHRHAMLDQLFLGLSKNDSIVITDDTETPFPEFSLLHIPLGSLHGVRVEDGKRMYYMWMDFFLTKEGEEWLKTHKPDTK
ncbi:hypothetical protein Pr1d_37840 [Bythopirellula goksoeyrii]|uniref:Cupin domain protein n=2 Tax=Bythopirellula goksoeyrii TaxID=1400387 RepID=A0A5B9QFM8_9BACT|nr:hypothetical protein Pr1d_37840 [Bythopirellula goksoeyrii]